MTDDRSQDDQRPSVPEPSGTPEPRFEEPEKPAPDVVDAPGRNTEF